MQIVTDGWSNKFAGQGAALMNVCITLPTGGSVFSKASCWL
jgi:hypothetical protein